MTQICTGTPTGPAVEKILEAIGELTPGKIIEYTTIEECCFSGKETQRYRTVVTALKRALWRSNGVVLAAARGVGYEILDPHKRVKFAADEQNKGVKKIKRGFDVAVSTEQDTLSPEERAACSRMALLAASLRLSELTQPRRVIAPPVE